LTDDRFVTDHHVIGYNLAVNLGPVSMLNMLNGLGNVSVPEQGQSFKMTVRLIKKGFIFSCKITSLKEENRMTWNA